MKKSLKYFLVLFVLLGVVSLVFVGIRHSTPSAPQKRHIPESIRIFDSLKDQTVFVKISDQDYLTWGELRKHVQTVFDSKNYIFSPPGLDLTPEEIEDNRKKLFISTANKTMRNYLRAAVVAHVARKKGFTVSDAEFHTTKTNAIAQYQKMGRRGAALAAGVNDSNAFYNKNATNVILALKYYNQVIKPGIKITDEDVNKVIRDRTDYNNSVAPSNTLMKLELAKILQDIKTNAIEFAEAANLHSEDGGDNGYFGLFSPGEGIKELEDVYSKMKPGEISEVVEAPHSYHILKLLKIHYDEDEDGNRKVENYELAHIMFEKYQKEPEWTREKAAVQALNSKALSEMKALQIHLLKTLPIESAVPLTNTPSRVTRKAPQTNIKVDTIRKNNVKQGNKIKQGTKKEAKQ